MTTANEIFSLISKSVESFGNANGEVIRLLPNDPNMFEVGLIARVLDSQGRWFRRVHIESEEKFEVRCDAQGIFDLSKLIYNRNLQDVWIFQDGIPFFIYIEGMGDFHIIYGTLKMFQIIGLESKDVSKLVFDNLMNDDEDEERLNIVWSRLEAFM